MTRHVVRSRSAAHLLWVVALLASPAAADQIPRPGTPLDFCHQLEQSDGPNLPARQQCLDIIMSGVDDKRLRFDRTATKGCLAAYRTYLKKETPDRLGAARQACSKAVVGLRRRGDACDSILDCESGLACIGKSGGPPGSCAAPLKAGAPCDETALNASALYALVGADRSACGPGRRCKAVDGALRCTAGD